MKAAKKQDPKKISMKNCQCRPHKEPGAVYGLGLIGALFYFLSHATSFLTVILGIIKSIFWPVVLVIKLFTFLQI